MIAVQFEQDQRKGTVSLTVKGHAGQAGEGRDIVCAAASMLAYTVAQTMRFLYEDGGLRAPPHIALGKGDALIAAKAKPDSYAEVLHTFFVAQVGYHLLARNYPQYVALTAFGGSDSRQGENIS